MVNAVVAEDHARAGEVEDGYACSDGCVGTVPVADDGAVGFAVVLSVKDGFAGGGHRFGCCCGVLR